MDDHMGPIDDACAEPDPDLSVIEQETRLLIDLAHRMLARVLQLQGKDTGAPQA
jgi:hypothetical protein